MSLWGKFTGWLNRNFQHPTINPPIMPVKDPGGVIDLDRLAALHARPDAVTAQQDDKASSLYQESLKYPPAYLDRTAQAARLDFLAAPPPDNWAPSERHLAQKKPRKRQPIKARKALKAVKAKKKAKRK